MPDLSLLSALLRAQTRAVPAHPTEDDTPLKVSMFLLLSLGGAFLTADLSPPYYPTERNRVGYWQIAGAAVASEDFVQLVLPGSRAAGGVWCNLPLPYGEWSIDFRLKIGGSGAGGFALWLIEEHGAMGEFYGGPSTFKGVAIVGVVSRESGALRVKIVQSKGEEKHACFGASDQFAGEFRLDSDEIELRLRVSSDRVEVVHGESAVSEPLEVPLGKAWLGVTGMDSEGGTRIDVVSGRFAVVEYMNQQKGHGGSRKRSRSHGRSQRDNRVLRNPTFAMMRKEIDSVIQAKGALDGDKGVEDVLKVCDEFADVLSDIPTFSDVNDFVRRQLGPYAQGWQRRSFKNVEQMHNTRRLLFMALNQSVDLLLRFSTSINEMGQKTDQKLGKLRDLLAEVDENNEIGTMVTSGQSKYVSVMMYTAIVELVLVVLFYVVQGIPCVHNRLI